MAARGMRCFAMNPRIATMNDPTLKIQGKSPARSIQVEIMVKSKPTTTEPGKTAVSSSPSYGPEEIRVSNLPAGYFACY